MRKITSLIVIIFLVIHPDLFAQKKYVCKNGYIQFYSYTPFEQIKAENLQVYAAVDLSTKDILVSLLIKSFRFEKPLMEEHFNENYLESDKYPKATFKGKIVNYELINFSKEGEYPITVEGDLIIHGIQKFYSINGVITVSGNNIEINGHFKIKPSDHNVIIPSVVRQKIAQEVDVTVKMKFSTVNYKIETRNIIKRSNSPVSYNLSLRIVHYFKYGKQIAC